MKKSLKKQAVFPVLMLLVVTALALIGSSFAWFSMSNTASVARISGKVEDSSVGLMISKDAVNFESSIDFSEGGASTFVVPKAFHQVSTKDGINFFEATITKKNADGTAALIYTTADSTVDWNSNGIAKGVVNRSAQTPEYANSGVASDASYMVLDLFFSVENASDLYLNYGTSFTLNNGNQAMRVAFLDYSGVAAGENASTQAIALHALQTSTSYLIWDPANETSYYGIKQASTASTVFKPYASANDAVADVSAASSTYADQVTTKTSAQLYPQTEATKLTDDVEDLSAYTRIADLQAGVNKIRVVVWLEGNDPSCVSSIAKSDIDFTLVFYARKTA